MIIKIFIMNMNLISSTAVDTPSPKTKSSKKKDWKIIEKVIFLIQWLRITEFSQWRVDNFSSKQNGLISSKA